MLEAALERIVAELSLKDLAEGRRFSMALVDLSERNGMRYAGINADEMLYAASLPKIAVLLAAFERVRGDAWHTLRSSQQELVRIIRYSDNSAASSLIRKSGFSFIAETPTQPRYRLYDPSLNGGLWVGKAYGGPDDRWRRDPLHRISDGATARQAARFFVMLDRGLLVDGWCSREMKEILSNPGIPHKFVQGLLERPGTEVYRKSGSWRDWHSDAALIERGETRYVRWLS